MDENRDPGVQLRIKWASLMFSGESRYRTKNSVILLIHCETLRKLFVL